AACRKPLLLGVLGVALNLAQRAVATDRHQLVRAVAGFGQAPHAALLETMQSTSRRQAYLGRPLREVVAEPVFGTWRPSSRDDIGEVRFRHGVACSLELGRHRNVHILAPVCALNADTAVLDVLRAE